MVPSHGKLFWIRTILFYQCKEPSLFNAQNFLNIFPFDFLLEIPLQKIFDMIVSKLLVDLSHILKPPFLSFRLQLSQGVLCEKCIEFARMF